MPPAASAQGMGWPCTAPLTAGDLCTSSVTPRATRADPRIQEGEKAVDRPLGARHGEEGRKEAYLCHSFLKENGRSNDRIGVPHAPR